MLCFMFVQIIIPADVGTHWCAKGEFPCLPLAQHTPHDSGLDVFL